MVLIKYKHKMLCLLVEKIGINPAQSVDKLWINRFLIRHQVSGWQDRGTGAVLEQIYLLLGQIRVIHVTANLRNHEIKI
jgi:hypothetical protein